MRKLSVFSVKLAWLPFTLMVLALALLSCKNPADSTPVTLTITFTINFNANGGTGTVPTALTVQAGSHTALPGGSGLTKTGYTFGGWNTNTAGTGNNYSIGSPYTPENDVTLYAKWNDVAVETTYTVTFDANGGTGTVPGPQTADIGSSIILPGPGNLSKTGYTFGGWNTNTAGTGTNYNTGVSYTNTANIVLFANWTEASNNFTVSFETNGGSVIDNVIILKNTQVSRPTLDPIRTGYTFDNWFINPELTMPYDFSSSVFRDTTLYAKWNTIIYTVIYNKNAVDALGTMEDSSHTYDVDKKLNTNAFTRTGYTFAGWARTSTGAIEFTDGTNVKNLTAVAGGTVNLYAQWNNINKTNPVVTWPTGLTAIYGQTLSSISLVLYTNGGTGAFSWTTPNTSVGNAGTQSHGMTFTPDDTEYYNTVTQNVDVTVTKAPGITVSTPTLNTRTHNSVTLNIVTASTGQTVQYAINSTNTAPSDNNAWQTGTTFNGLNAGTVYYFFARAVGNSNYETGAASGSLTVTTLQTVPVNKIEYYWVNEQDVIATTSSDTGNAITLPRGETLTITANGNGYLNQRWYINGAEDILYAGNAAYLFSSEEKDAKRYVLTLIVEKGGKYYNANFAVTVTE